MDLERNNKFFTLRNKLFQIDPLKFSWIRKFDFALELK